MIDASIIHYAVKYPGGMTDLLQAGVSQEDFPDQEWKTVWRYLMRMRREHDTVPSPDVLRTRFPDIELPPVRKRDIPILLNTLRQRSKYIRFLTALQDAASQAVSYESVDEAIQELQAKVNAISFTGSGRSHLVDLFSTEINERMQEELQRRRSGEVIGFRTGLARFDRIAGGLQRQQMVVAIGRPGIGKSWLDLLFVASAVIDGAEVMLYPLEMTLAETAFRLYTLMSQKMFGPDKVLRNYDLTSGRANPRKVARFLNFMEDRYKGKLHVADVASLADPYTNERIEAEVEMHRPDMFWVDYLTLLKPPPRQGSDGDWSAVRHLSNGIKNTAMRRNVVGGCSAQVNREAMRGNIFLPRLEHISYGDSIGQDADKVFSLNRRGDYLHYALVKNRGGRELGVKNEKGIRMRFMVDEGILEETTRNEADEEGES